MFDLCVLHIGTEKTGTTSIQNFLLNNMAKLRDQGFFFPASFGLPSQTGLAVYAGRTSKLGSLTIGIGSDEDSLNKFRENTLANFQRELSGTSDCHTLLLSNEHLHSRLRNEHDLNFLKEFLLGFARNVKVLVYLRRQDRVAVSLASTYYKAGYPVTWKLPRCVPALPYYYDYQKLLDNYSKIFGSDNCVVRLFDPDYFKNRDLIQDYCGQTEIAFSQDFRRHREENQSLSLLGQRLLIELNKHIPRSASNERNPIRRNLVAVVSEHYPGKPPLLARADAQQFYQNFKKGNADVRKRFFPDLTREDLFDEDFSSYPERLPNEDHSFEQGCEAAALLWAWQAEKVHMLREQVRRQSEIIQALKVGTYSPLVMDGVTSSTAWQDDLDGSDQLSSG